MSSDSDIQVERIKADAAAIGPHSRAVSQRGAVNVVTEPGGTTNLSVIVRDLPALTPEQRQALEAQYLRGVIERYQQWEQRYTNLAAWTDTPREGDVPFLPPGFEALERRGEGPQREIERIHLDSLQEALRRYPRFIVLGDPGSGKTTSLQRLAWEEARRCLQTPEQGQIPLLASLNEFRGDDRFFDFLDSQLGPLSGRLAEYLIDGRLLLLLDALNEMPRTDYLRRLSAVRAVIDALGDCRCVVTCRSRDYQYSLNLQQVEVEPLDDDRIQEFLRRYLGVERAATLWPQIRDDPSDFLRLARNPFMLTMLAVACGQKGALPANRGDLFARFVTRLLQREEEKGHSEWPGITTMRRSLATLAFAMQDLGTGTAVSRGWATERLAPFGPGEILLDLARDATLLDEPRPDEIRFYHHLIQEYCAAEELIRRFTAGERLDARWRAPVREREMVDPPERGEWDPLPSPPQTGWEETTILAAGLMEDPAPLVKAVRRVNPSLAGRCLREAGVMVPDDLADQVRDDLLHRLRDVRVALRVRLEAGHILGRVGDPRFRSVTVNGVRVIPPRLAAVPAGWARLGSDRWDRMAFSDERPAHRVWVDAFWMGVWPVTNAEYARFLDAGGYEDERWWDAPGLRWLRGEAGHEAEVQRLIEIRDALRRNFDWQREVAGLWSPQQIELYERLSRMSDVQIEAMVRDAGVARPRRQPRFWDDPAYDNPIQPVVGVNWHEARAYCAWLSHVLGSVFRLPTEAEWERAARGNSRWRRYPWGWRWDAARANTLEGRVLRTSPVGAYPQGGSRWGIEDLAGNVWEWTSSLYRPYPYVADDGREDPEADGARVLRGGSWYDDRRVARCTYRGSGPPLIDFVHYGFRVVSVSPGSLQVSGF